MVEKALPAEADAGSVYKGMALEVVSADKSELVVEETKNLADDATEDVKNGTAEKLTSPSIVESKSKRIRKMPMYCNKGLPTVCNLIFHCYIFELPARPR